ncbi:hypothetical protein HMN09_01173500 [Mycena chlorophos]|uniref:Uncharacterized protein n=1 Tax=Mycena chlorophos TaxID=658473 RepID=A0A8H6S6I0_MYCCL|nr:hypothetical protein HMN09_01173500 [Mycena chlorophos]
MASFTSPTKRRVPLQPYTPPVHRLTPSGRPMPPIGFDYATAKIPGQGVSMRELRLRGPEMHMRMQGAGDCVFAPSGLQRIVFRIIWPGYTHVEWCRTMPVVAPNAGGAPITRVGLAVQIASTFANYFEKTQYEQPSSADWMISPACVQFKHLYLIALVNTAEGVWQADVALDVI